MKRVAVAVAVLVIVSGCVSMVRTDLMLDGYKGKNIQQFISEQSMMVQATQKIGNGDTIYEFHGGTGGPACRMFLTTDDKGTIIHYRFENC